MKKNILNFFLLSNIAIITYFWWNHSSMLFLDGTKAGLLIALGRLSGLIAEFAILTELVLISRVPLIEKTYGFDNLNKLHRWIGYGLLVGIFSHPILLVIGYAYLNGVPFFDQFVEFIRSFEDVLKAVFAFALLIGVGFISLPIIRKKLRYETWHATHLLMYVSIGLAFGHQIKTADVSYGIALYYWLVINFLVFGSVLVYRFMHPFVLYNRHKFFVEKIFQETHDVYSVHIGGENMDKFLFDAGQYIHVSFLTKGLWQPHPFSISLAPNGRQLRISVKDLGDYTSKIKTLKSGTRIIIEGPFGRFTESVSKNDKFLLIAGGIGITPIRALAESLSNHNHDTVLLYGNKTENDIVFKNELQSIKAKSIHVLSQSDTKSFETGRIDENKIKALVPDYRDRDIYVCGPKSMIDSIHLSLKNLNIPKSHIHFEKFSY